ncbi:MAG TPA: carboxypeptidase regulatory-like domain-containing protein [Gemmatimonadaceae bacterium]|nr:carboxypeptidase regulatory-like domain-containing protein [Gemmatimonadaceae bacterium]
MRRPSFVLAGIAVASLVGATATAQSTPSYKLTGLVHDEANAPVMSAELRLAHAGQLEQAVRTDASGHFEFSGIHPGDFQLSIRRLGYKVFNRNFTVSNSEPAPLDIAMETVTDLDPVYVEGEDMKLKEFNQRRTTNNFGKFIDADEIKQRDPRSMTEMLRTIPGATLTSGKFVGNRLTLRGCKPTVWVNGMKAYGAELDEVANPPDVAGLEVYLSWAGLPPQYQDRENPGCGAILVWTKDRQ